MLRPNSHTHSDAIPRKHSEWGLASLAFGTLLFAWIMLPNFGVPPERVDVFGNLGRLGPMLSTVGVVIASIGICQKGRDHFFAQVAVVVNLINCTMSAGLFYKNW